MAARLTLADIQEGTLIPSLVRKPGEVQMFLISAVTWNAHRIHWDYRWATEQEGYPNLVVHGAGSAWLSQMLINWAGDVRCLRRLSHANRAPAYLGDTLTCQGKVTGISTDGGVGWVECAVRITNQHGQECVVGTATLVLPLAR